jgi:N-acetylglucosamine-6-phosphate deacetylase
MEHKLTGKIVLPDKIINYGTVIIENGIITDIHEEASPNSETCSSNWILPGFIDIHLHGLGEGDPATYDGLIKMATFAPSTGVTRLCPTLGTAKFPVTIQYLKNIHSLVSDPPDGALIAGAHLEGPYINPERPGGMDINLLRNPDIKEIEDLLEVSAGTLKLITLSPEIPDIDKTFEMFKAAGCVISAGHTICPPKDFSQKVQSGVSHVCHLFDTFEGREVNDGVSHACLADMVLIEDRVTCEVIMDGMHVPAPLVKLARRAAGADRIIAITDAMQGAGLPDGEYSMSDGRIYTLTNGGLCRMKSNGVIVGSCLTMNQAFINMTEKFGFAASEASKALATNPARLLGLEKETGKIAKGLSADIAVLSPEGNVKECYLKGKIVYGN